LNCFISLALFAELGYVIGFFALHTRVCLCAWETYVCKFWTIFCACFLWLHL